MEIFLKDLRVDEISESRFFYHEGASGIKLQNKNKNKFWSLYCDGVASGTPMYITEISKGKIIPLSVNVVCDFDTGAYEKFVKNHGVDKIIESVENNIKGIVKKINVQLSDTFKGNDMKHTCCWLERKTDHGFITNDTTTYYECQIHFPRASIDKTILNAFSTFIDAMSEDFKVNESEDEQSDSDTDSDSEDDSEDEDSVPQRVLPDTPQSASKIIIPENPNRLPNQRVFIRTCKTHFLLYGSTNEFNKEPLSLKGVYDKFGKELELSSVFDINKHKDSKYIIDTDNKPLTHWLPLFLSDGYASSARCLQMTRSGKTLFNVDIDYKTANNQTKFDDSSPEEQHLKRILYLLKKSRFDNRESWFDIGKGIWSVFPGEKGVALWKWASVMNEKSVSRLQNHWYTFKKPINITHMTIEWYAYQDSRRKYLKIMNEKFKKYMVTTALHSARIANLAIAFQTCYPFDYAYSDVTGMWYRFEQHGWEEMKGDCIPIKDCMNDEFVKKIQELEEETKLSLQRIPAENKAEIETITKLLKGFTNIIDKLLTPKFKDSLLTELKNKYNNKYFTSDHFDTNMHFTRTSHGVIDVTGGKIKFRVGKPEDYLTKKTTDFKPDMFTTESKIVQETESYIKQVFRTEGLRDFMWCFLCSLFEAGNLDRIFPIMTGCGNNSKSMLMKLISEAFGSYSTVLPTSLVSGSRSQADSAMPSLKRCVGTRIAFLQEPEKDAPINSGIVKELTGNDKMYIRDLYEKGSQIRDTLITCVVVLVCNQIPEIPDSQQAIWNRTRVIKFASEWKTQDEAPKSFDEQMSKGIFPMDNKFDKKLVKMAPALLWLIYNKYEECAKRNGLPKPQEITTDTKAFQSACDIFSQFFDEFINFRRTQEGKLDPAFELKVKDVYDKFKIWVKSENHRMPKKAEFVDRLNKLVGHTHLSGPQRWIGLEFKDE